MHNVGGTKEGQGRPEAAVREGHMGLHTCCVFAVCLQRARTLSTITIMGLGAAAHLRSAHTRWSLQAQSTCGRPASSASAAW